MKKKIKSKNYKRIKSRLKVELNSLLVLFIFKISAQVLYFTFSRYLKSILILQLQTLLLTMASYQTKVS